MRFGGGFIGADLNGHRWLKVFPCHLYGYVTRSQFLAVAVWHVAIILIILGNVMPTHRLNTGPADQCWKFGGKIIEQIRHHGAVISEAQIWNFWIASRGVWIAENNRANTSSMR